MILKFVLWLISVVISILCGLIKFDKKEDCKWVKLLPFVVFVIATLCAGIDKLGLADYMIVSILTACQKYSIYICVYVFIVAMLSPIAAYIEQKRRRFVASKWYPFLNFFFNIVGAFCACAMFMIAIYMIEDFNRLMNFPLADIVGILVPLCTGLVLAYQNIELKNEKLDHDASPKWINQMFNMLHLFQVYFLASVSVVVVVAYTIYCHMHRIGITMHLEYYVFLSFALLFFYIISQHQHDYLRLIFTIMVPVILAASVYWMSWFSMDTNMRWCQWGFILGHSVVYILLYCNQFFRNQKGDKDQKDDKNQENDIDQKNEKIKSKIIVGVNKYAITVVLLLITTTIYTLVWIVPLYARRLGTAEATKYIAKICDGTGIDAEEVIEEMKKRPMYDGNEMNYDMEGFLKFVTERLNPQITDKGILNDGDNLLSYGDLKTWYLETP